MPVERTGTTGLVNNLPDEEVDAAAPSALLGKGNYSSLVRQPAVKRTSAERVSSLHGPTRGTLS